MYLPFSDLLVNWDETEPGRFAPLLAFFVMREVMQSLLEELRVRAPETADELASRAEAQAAALLSRFQDQLPSDSQGTESVRRAAVEVRAILRGISAARAEATISN